MSEVQQGGPMRRIHPTTPTAKIAVVLLYWHQELLCLQFLLKLWFFEEAEKREAKKAAWVKKEAGTERGQKRRGTDREQEREREKKEREREREREKERRKEGKERKGKERKGKERKGKERKGRKEGRKEKRKKEEKKERKRRKKRRRKRKRESQERVRETWKKLIPTAAFFALEGPQASVPRCSQCRTKPQTASAALRAHALAAYTRHRFSWPCCRGGSGWRGLGTLMGGRSAFGRGGPARHGGRPFFWCPPTGILRLAPAPRQPPCLTLVRPVAARGGAALYA